MVEGNTVTMILKRLFDERHAHVLDHVMFKHQEDFNHQEMMGLLKKIEREMVIREPILSVRKRVFDVAAEMLDNIIHHASSNEERPPIFILSEQSRDYLLMSVNRTTTAHRDRLSHLLDTLSQMDKTALNGLYKSIMRGKVTNGVETLGWLRIAKKLKDPIAYHHQPINNEGNAYFAVIAAIPK